jgi:hypothetical protein
MDIAIQPEILVTSPQPKNPSNQSFICTGEFFRKSRWKFAICLLLAPGRAQAAYLEDVPVNVTQPDSTVHPTLMGNTAITAHVWDADNNPGHFVNLHTLTHGDQIIIHAYGQRYTYEVRQMQQVRPDTLRALPHEEQDVLTLIT